MLATLHHIIPDPPCEAECMSPDKKWPDFDHNLMILRQRDAAARLIGRPVFLHVLLLNCDYISLKMFQIRKNSMNIFEIYKNISLFNIYIFQNI